MNENPSYYAVIPANVRYDNDLTANAKLLYAEISSLCNQKGYCWANNEYFANLYGVSKTSISKWISQLISKNYLKSVLIYKDDTKEILNRYLSLVTYPIEEKLNTPIEEKLKDNTKLLNNKINIKSNNVEKEKKSTTTEFPYQNEYKKKDIEELKELYLTSTELKTARETILLSKFNFTQNIEQRTKSLQTALTDFNNSLRQSNINEKLQNDYISHFRNWLNKQDFNKYITKQPNERKQQQKQDISDFKRIFG